LSNRRDISWEHNNYILQTNNLCWNNNMKCIFKHITCYEKHPNMQLSNCTVIKWSYNANGLIILM
jgi:hypothetical protein